jgi:hypothetical protein
MDSKLARQFIAGSFADFLIFLAALPDPIIVGGTYPRNKLMQAFQSWTEIRDFNTNNADLSAWRTACSQGVLK